jgi:hypothetical protein
MIKKYYILIMLIAVMGCQKAYNPHAIAIATNYLVVEGTISTGSDSTIIQLSRTVPLNSATRLSPELGAMVMIINNAGNSYPLTETGNGFYKAAGLNTGTTNTYGLRITTTDGRVYQSDLVVVKNSPPIDSVYYRVKGNGLEIYSDSHDPANNTRYYRYSYDETWQFHSAFESYDYLSTSPVDTVLPRSLSKLVYTCWRSDTASTILLNSTAKLVKDVVSENPVTFIASTSEKIGNRYSILVKQYALTVDAFNYYQQLKNNTENLGSIFDAQPSELPGNIHCISNPAEPVLGYMTAGSPAESRIFIDIRNLPAWLPITPYDGCRLDTDLFARVEGAAEIINQVKLYIYTGVDSPVFIYAPPGSASILGYGASSPFCVDCTLRGTNIQPSFWVNGY